MHERAVIVLDEAVEDLEAGPRSTTAAGLIIGIPAMVAYFIMRSRLANQMTATAQTATDLVDILSGQTTETAE